MAREIDETFIEEAIERYQRLDARQAEFDKAVRTVEVGDRFTVNGFGVEAVGGQHAEIYEGLPGCANIGFIVDGVYHPGDALHVPSSEVVTLQPSPGELAPQDEGGQAQEGEQRRAGHPDQSFDAGCEAVDRVVPRFAHARCGHGSPVVRLW